MRKNVSVSVLATVNIVTANAVVIVIVAIVNATVSVVNSIRGCQGFDVVTEGR